MTEPTSEPPVPGDTTPALEVSHLDVAYRVRRGRISTNGRDPLSMGKPALRDLRAKTVSMVYQEPGRALNPSMRAGRQIAEVYEIAGASAGEARRPGQDTPREI